MRECGNMPGQDRLYSECIMQGHSSWFSIRIHIPCHYSMRQAMGPCKIERDIRRLHQNLATLPDITAPRRISKNRGQGRSGGIGSFLNGGFLYFFDCRPPRANHRCCKISSSSRRRLANPWRVILSQRWENKNMYSTRSQGAGEPQPPHISRKTMPK